MSFRLFNFFLRTPASRKFYKQAFTLSEVLITLGIIGIIAAMTLPAIIGKYQKSVTINKLKKVNTILSQMLLQSYNDNGSASSFLTAGEQVSAENTEIFFKTYWLPYFNNPTVARDGMSFYYKNDAYVYKQLNNATYTIAVITSYSGGRVLFRTNDGIIFLVHLMKWDETKDEEGKTISAIARYRSSQIVYVDINGIREPNKLGKDVFILTADFEKNIIKPYEYGSDSIDRYCSTKSSGETCFAKIVKDGWKIADDYPW